MSCLDQIKKRIMFCAAMTGMISMLWSAVAGAAGAGITYHGRLIDRDGRAVESSNVQFKLQIRTPGNENCLMYEEVQVKDLSQTSGAFAVTINDGTGTRLDSTGYSLDQIFANRNSFTFAGGNCATGNSFPPSSTDSRRIQVLFNDGTFPIGQWEPVPPMAINFVPMAIESMQVGGYKKEQLIKIADGVSTTGTELSSASWTELLALIAGTSTQFIKPTGTIGGSTAINTSGNLVTSGTVSGLTVSATNLRVYNGADYVQFTAPALSGANVLFTLPAADGTAGQVLKTNGGGVLSWISPSAGAVTSVGLALPAEITVSNSPVTTTGSLTGAWANQTTNKVFAAPNGSTGTPTFRALLSADLPVVDIAHGGTGQSSTFTANALMMANGTGAAMTTGLTCGLNEIPKWNATTWVCVTIPTSGSPSSGVIGAVQASDGASGFLADAAKFFWDNTAKRLGVGTNAPAATLEVVGDVKIGNSAAACSATTKGSIRYNNASSVLEFCNGTSWNLVQAAACTDAAPTNFTFTDQTNVTVSTLTTSNIVQIVGINCRVPLSISGSGSPAYRTCSDAACATVIQDWTSVSGSIGTGEYLQIRQTSNGVGGVSAQNVIIIGSVASVWTVATTGVCDGSQAIGTVCADGTVYAGMSPDVGGVQMFTQRCDYGQAWNGTNCAGSRLPQNWNKGTTSWTVTGYTNANTGKTNSAGISALADAGSTHYAARACEDLNEGGHTDWYLPAWNELLVLYANKNTILNFLASGDWYWSSTEMVNYEARMVRWSDGAQNGGVVGYKNSAYYVRCVRR